MPGTEAMPFSAVTGNTKAKMAVLCFLANQHLKCLMLTGRPGTGKTAIVRSIPSLCLDVPVRYAPIGTTEERLFGTVDVEKAVTEGKLETEKGLFEEADGGMLCIDGIDLMDTRTALEAAETAITGKVDIEKDGTSAHYSTDVSLIATTSENVRGLDGHLTDRFDVCVQTERPEDGDIVRSVRDRILIDDGNTDILERYDLEDSEIRKKIECARRLIPEVRLLKRHREAISCICIKYGVKGYRGPISCAETAVALAALDGRRKTSDEDVVEASELCLDHRRTKFETIKKTTVPEQERMFTNKDILRFVHDDRKQNANVQLTDKINEV